jgi:hypothetical protein
MRAGRACQGRYHQVTESCRALVQVLRHWHAAGHKALWFTQTQQMLDICERAVQAAGFR